MGRPLTGLEKVLRGLAVVTLLLTIPQAVSVWQTPQGNAAVSLVTWSSYLVAAIAWLVYGLRQRDPQIYLECIGWIVLDAAIIAGVLVRA